MKTTFGDYKPMTDDASEPQPIMGSTRTHKGSDGFIHAGDCPAAENQREPLTPANFLPDYYTEKAKELFGVDVVTPEQRDAAKRVTWAFSYGASASRMAPIIARHRKSVGHFGLCDECKGEHDLDLGLLYIHQDCGYAHNFKGWYCTRSLGHDGPCALIPAPPFHELRESWEQFTTAVWSQLEPTLIRILDTVGKIARR